MTVLIQPSPSSPAPTYADDRFVVVHDPKPGTIVELAPGSQLAVTFRRGLGPSRWRVTGLPGHLVLLSAGGHVFQFLVFDGSDGAVPVRFERRRSDHEMAHEVCELLVVPDSVSRADARTSTSA
ncbi:MAG TPA: hypothetical protein VFV89_06630 [Nocardioides sp.]|uniref:hypothetical protein n=1 Tax=Nocardioides sp. TaxID=35761 RepID=UPI002E335FEE|nr:hypothetical protein [Nocardioides sp.]HEX5087467.1 hypothetical protein [Nocardioides sp.]